MKISVKKTGLVLVALAASALILQAEEKTVNIMWFGSSSTPPQLIQFVNEMLDAEPDIKIGWSDKARGYFNSAYFVKHGENLKVNVGNGKSVEEFTELYHKGAAQRKIDFAVVQVRHHTVIYPEIEAKAAEYMKRFCDAIRAKGTQVIFWVSFRFATKFV